MKLRNLIHILIGIVCIGLLPKAQAISPAPDGGYPASSFRVELDAVNAVQQTGCNVTAPSQQTSGAKSSAEDQNSGPAYPAISLPKGGGVHRTDQTVGPLSLTRGNCSPTWRSHVPYHQ